MPEYKKKYIQYRGNVRRYLNRDVLPLANQFDSNQCIPREFFRKLAENGVLSGMIPEEYHGLGCDYVCLSILHEELAKISCSVENVVTVLGMVVKPLVRFGSAEQKEKWLPLFASAKVIPAIALSEPDIGSDLKSVNTYAEDNGDYYTLTGAKRYITLGQIADLFLVLAKTNEGHITLLVEKGTEGLCVKPILGLLGMRSNMLAEIQFNESKVPKHNRLGSVGMGLSPIAQIALDEGRFTTACGAVGLSQACLNEVLKYTDKRKQFGSFLKEHALIQKMTTEMIVNTNAARELCFSAALKRESCAVSYINETLIAKYAASKAAVKSAGYALQILAASGFTEEHVVSRYYRDAKAMELIEGTSQMCEMQIPNTYFDEFEDEITEEICEHEQNV